MKKQSIFDDVLKEAKTSVLKEAMSNEAEVLDEVILFLEDIRENRSILEEAHGPLRTWNRENIEDYIENADIRISGFGNVLMGVVKSLFLAY